MSHLQSIFLRALSIGLHSGLSEGKKFALKVATLDAYWSATVMFFYVFYSFENNLGNIAYVHLFSLSMILLGIVLIYQRFYDFARVLIHLTGLFEIFMGADGVGVNSGYEFYYFTQVLIPHITWSLDEKWWKSASLSILACVVLIFQQIIGPGVFLNPVIVPAEDKIVAIIFVVLYTISVLIAARWKLQMAQKRVTEQQDEIIHSTSLIALGEMSGGIAHEINNPLQNLSLQLRVLDEKIKKGNLTDTERNIQTMDATIQKMGRMVQGLKDLSRKDQGDKEQFIFSRTLDDVVLISADRLRKYEIDLTVTGTSKILLVGNSIQYSQVLINLMNNSIDAIKSKENRWIKIEIDRKGSFLQVAMIDSGEGIAKDVAAEMMKPFFTTKLPSKGTGLGLSISQSILDRNGGKLYYDAYSPQTRFVMMLPLSEAALS